MEKEARIRALTKLYYSNPKIQEALAKFSKNREAVPRYYEGFGKRPDTILYPSDVINLVNRGATSFHCSQELWNNPFSINLDMNADELKNERIGWDLLIDVDSSFLDCSKIATELILAALENWGIKNYGLKFSGSKGFHIIVPSPAFPEEYGGIKTKNMFPEWPRAISEYIMNYIRDEYNKRAAEILTNFEAIEERINVKKEDLLETNCLNCGRKAKRGWLSIFSCPVCSMIVQRRDIKIGNKKLRCVNTGCPGILELKEEKEYYYCENCKDSDNERLNLSSDKYPEMFKEVRGISAEKIAKLDLVLVASRHLFRMPYSLNEKTALSSIVLTKEELRNFTPRDADPLNVRIRDFILKAEKDEAKNLLAAALEWKKSKSGEEESIERKKYSRDEKIDATGVNEGMFPEPIKKLQLGLKDGKKRGLFILSTFLRCLNFSEEYINIKIREWNKLNEPQIKEGYIKSQLNWLFRQKKQIFPPNYSNKNFYEDLGLMDKKREAKNPVSEVLKEARRR